jgi:hypothetical protein
MKIRVALSKDGNVIASEILVNPRPGTVTQAGARVFAEARQILKDEPLWDYALTAREVLDA